VRLSRILRPISSHAGLRRRAGACSENGQRADSVCSVERPMPVGVLGHRLIVELLFRSGLTTTHLIVADDV